MTHPSAQDLRKAFEQAGQGQVFAFYEKLTPKQQEHLASQAAQIDLAEIARLNDKLVRGSNAQSVDLTDLEPHPYIARPEKGGDATLWAKAREAGEAALRAGRVAAFVVAGGQGTRLGYDGPKGTFAVTPVKKKSLFQIFAEKIKAASDRYGKVIPWYIMTSHINHAATVAFFEEHKFFGLDTARVKFFRQGLMPAVDFNGKILLEEPDTIAMSPDGHGGSLRALVRSGAIAEMEAAGIDVISYFQVDNPLVHCIDPEFIGFHLQGKSEMSSKMLPKAYPKEKLGHFCLQRGKLVVIEYSDMPDSLVEQRDAQGNLRYIAGSIAIHVLSRDFVKRLGEGRDHRFALPFHRADKKIKTVDAQGHAVKPEKPNGVKFEMFVFDALPFAANPVIIETLREDDFSPVKNAEGVDSPQTCRDDQLRQFARWLKAVNVAVPTDPSGLPPFALEVSPRFATDTESFRRSWQALEPKPAIKDGTYLA